MSTSIADIPDESQAQPHRVAVYVDGLNLYHGLKSRRWRRYYWLNLHRLAERLLLSDQSLVMIRYFTARFLPRFDDPRSTPTPGYLPEGVGNPARLDDPVRVPPAKDRNLPPVWSNVGNF